LAPSTARRCAIDIVAAVPHRELLLVFNAEASAGMAEVVDAEHGAARKPLTTGLFVLSPDGPTPKP
jgi:hypothetical protein